MMGFGSGRFEGGKVGRGEKGGGLCVGVGLGWVRGWVEHCNGDGGCEGSLAGVVSRLYGGMWCVRGGGRVGGALGWGTITVVV